MSTETRVAVDIWSDYVCPFCYLELPAVNRLKQEYGTRIEVTWHAFELRPDPVPALDPQGAYLRDTWERSVYPMAREIGLPLRLPPVQPRSRKAFEAAEHAKTLGLFDAMHDALFRSFFIEGKDIEDTETLLDIALELGIPLDPLKGALDAGRYTRRVLDDEELAHKLGITGVPQTLVGRHGHAVHGFSGAQVLRGTVPYDNLRAAVEHLLQG